MTVRPAEHLVHGLDGPVAVIDGRICGLLNRMLGLDKFRVKIRGQDAQLDQALIAIKLAGTRFTESSATGSRSAPQAEVVSCSPQHENNTISTAAAATVLGITDRAIRQAIAGKRLAATQNDSGHWRITREDLAAYMAQRSGDR